jgi:uncharacterized membrane protein YfcA
MIFGVEGIHAVFGESLFLSFLPEKLLHDFLLVLCLVLLIDMELNVKDEDAAEDRIRIRDRIEKDMRHAF